jgi:hypothetical protein
VAVIPAKVAAFTRDQFQTLEDLQVLLACMENTGRWWDPADLAQHLGIAPVAAQRSLDRLTRHSLFDIRVTDSVKYRFSPGTTELAGDAAAWIEEYRRNPIAVMKLVTDPRTLSGFTDAAMTKRHDDR